MSIFANANEDAKTLDPTQVSTGGRLGFLGSFEAAYDESVRYSSSMGAQQALFEEENENRERIRKAGGKVPDGLSGRVFDSTDYFVNSTAPYWKYIEALQSGDDSAVSSVVGDRDSQLQKLQREFPDAGIQTYKEMFGTVRKKSDVARQNAERPRTLLGEVGGFIGGLAGGVNPVVNPIGAATLPLGGFGEGAAVRIGTEAAAGGVGETINQFTGVRGNQRALGGNPTIGEAVANIAGQAAGAGLLQAGGEVLGAIGRRVAPRWFADAPLPEQAAPALLTPEIRPPEAIAQPAAPELPVQGPLQPVAVPASTMELIQNTIRRDAPAGKTRMGTRAALSDLEYTSARIDTWNPEGPVRDLLPPTMTRIPGVPDPAPRFTPVRAAEQSVDDIARQVDPDTFRIYDKLAETVKGLRSRIAATQTLDAEGARNASAAEARAVLDAAKTRLTTAKGKQRRRLEAELSELQDAFQRNFQNVDVQGGRNRGEIATRLRNELQAADAQMRDLAPTVSRAYARARNVWQATDDIRQAVAEMSARGDTALPTWLPERLPPAPETVLVPRAIRDVVPELRSPLAQGTNGPAVLEAQRVAREEAKVGDAATDAFRAGAARVLADEASDVVEYNGKEYRLGEKVMIPRDDGTFREGTVREMLVELDEDEQVLKAVTSCQI